MKAKGGALVALALVSGGLLTAVLLALRDEVPARRQPPMQAAAVPALVEASESKPRSPPQNVPLRRIPPRDVQARSLVVSLDSNREITISARPMRMPAIARPQRLIDIYEELTVLAAQGDASAGYSLHRWLRECGRLPEGEAGLERALQRLRKEGVVPRPDGSLRRVSDVPHWEAVLRRNVKFCHGITKEQREQADKWLEKATSTGEVFALEARASLLKTLPSEYFPIYQSLWEDHGYVGALAPLAIAYKRGVEGGAPDYVRAYAYKYAELKLEEAVYGTSVFPSHRGRLMALENTLRTNASYLNPQETQKATELGQRLLENPNCCVGAIFGTTY